MASNAVIAQSGGPTAVINQSLVGCVEALAGDDGIGKVFGARHAVRGMLEDDFIDLSSVPHDALEQVAVTPSAALGSSRDKPNASYCERVFEVLARRDIHAFFYIGGNDSADTCRIIRETADSAGYDLKAFHIPKTVDNDLVLNDHTPGYGSAARFVAMAFMGDNLDNVALPGVKINVVMGRNAGFLTASSALGARRDDDGPHLIYLPERVFDPEQFVEDVDRVYTRLGRCQVAVSEGIRDRAGNLVTAMMSEMREVDAHGNIQLSGTGALGDFLAERLRHDLGARRGMKIRVRADTFGYVQRSFFETSPVDREEARRAGQFAALQAISGADSGSITLNRESTDPYRVSFGMVDLASIAARTKTMPDAFIDADRRGVTEAFLRYAAPLVGDLPQVGRL